MTTTTIARRPDRGVVAVMGEDAATFLHGVVTNTIKTLAPGEAQALIRSLRIHPLRAGARGKPPADIDALADCVEAVATLMLEHPEVSEIEINPLRVFERGRGAIPLDALMVVGES